MAPKYATMKNAELESLLKERNLPHTGKKAEMVARLEEDDKKKNEDEIDWDDDAGDAPAEKSIETAPIAEETDSKVEGNNPQAVANQEAAIDPSATEDLAVKQPVEGATTTNGAETVKEKTPVDYSIGIASTDLDKELAARKKRAERFGVKQEEQDANAIEAQKRLERAKKFGEVDAETNKLDTALSDRRKRGREGGEENGDFKRRGGGRSGRFRGGRFRGRGGAGGERREAREGGSSWMSSDDRAKAEARKARFNQG